jgi:hypothetical protein
MKRDWDVIREVLVEVEGLSESTRHAFNYSYDETSSDVARAKCEQALLLWKAGFISAIDAGNTEGPAILSPELTWQGHDLLDTIRSKAIWEKIKSTAREKGIELTFDAVKTLGKAALGALVGSD